MKYKKPNTGTLRSIKYNREEKLLTNKIQTLDLRQKALLLQKMSIDEHPNDDLASGMALICTKVLSRNSMSILHLFQPLVFVSIMGELKAQGMSEEKSLAKSLELQAKVCDLVFDGFQELGVSLGNNNIYSK